MTIVMTMMIVALLVSLNHDDGGVRTMIMMIIMIMLAAAGHARVKTNVSLGHLPPPQVEDEADPDRVRHLDGELEPRDEFGRP